MKSTTSIPRCVVAAVVPLFFAVTSSSKAEPKTFCISGNDYVVVRTQPVEGRRCVNLAEQVKICASSPEAVLTIIDADVNTVDTTNIEAVRIVFDYPADEMTEIVFGRAPHGFAMSYRGEALVRKHAVVAPPCSSEEMTTADSLLDTSNNVSAEWRDMQKRLQRQ